MLMGRPRFPVEVQERFWQAYAAGVVVREAAALAGVSPSAGGSGTAAMLVVTFRGLRREFTDTLRSPVDPAR